MKKIILNIALLLIGTCVFAQGNKITEGTITYTVEWKLPEQMQAMASSFPTEIKVYFKGDSSSLKTESAMYSSTNILNFNKEYERLLLNIPMMGKKILGHIQSGRPGKNGSQYARVDRKGRHRD